MIEIVKGLYLCLLGFLFESFDLEGDRMVFGKLYLHGGFSFQFFALY